MEIKTNISYIDWRSNEFPYKGTVQDIYEVMMFDDPDDDFIVFKNAENGKYAVYYELHNGGQLISLVEDFMNLMCLSLHANDGFDQRVERLFEQHALDYGFPEKHPKAVIGHTVRIHRICDVWVPTRDIEEAKKIGRILASGGDASTCFEINDAMCGCNDELHDVWPVYSHDGFWDMGLNRGEVRRLAEMEG